MYHCHIGWSFFLNLQGLDYIMVGKLGLESLGDDLAEGLDEAEQDDSDSDSTSEVEEEESDVDNEDQNDKGDNSCVRDHNSDSNQIS